MTALAPPPTPSQRAHASFLHTIVPFIPVLAVAIFGVGYGVILRPRFAELRDLRQRHMVEREVADLEQRVAQLATTRTTFERSLASKREVIDAALPGGEDVPGLFVTLDAAAQRVGVVISTMEVTREPPPKTLQALGNHDVLLVGLSMQRVDYARLKSFLDVVASSRRLIDVLSVQFSPQALSATIRVRAYTME